MAVINSKQAIKEAIERLGDIKIMIADDDHRIAGIIKEILATIGFKGVVAVRNGEDALRLMRTENIDILITDWRMTPMDGISLIKYIRNNENSPNRFLPIIMLTGNVEREQVEIARDSGITELVIKPFSAKTLCDRIALLIEHPRGFVVTKGFVGPDRRRRLISPPDNCEKRKNR
jgi:two-component system, chemotaxis family, chemotaxis protein CheY